MFYSSLSIFSVAAMSIFWPPCLSDDYLREKTVLALQCCSVITFEHEELPLFPPDALLDLVSGCLSFLILCLVILMSLSLWQPERFIKLVTEVPVELQPLSLLFIQQEAIDVGEKLIGCHRGDEALSVQSELVQQQHAEVVS